MSEELAPEHEEDDFWAYSQDDDTPEDACRYCGKPFEDWSDLGCERCDSRHPGWGTAL